MSDTKLIASCGQEVKIHEWPSGKTVYSLSPPSGVNNFGKSISWSVSGRQLLAIPSGSKPVIIKKLTELKEIKFTRNNMERGLLSNVGLFSKNSEELVTLGSVNGEIHVADILSNKIIKTFTTLPSPITFLDYTPKDTFLAAGCKNGQIYLYNTSGDVCSSFFVPWSLSLSTMTFHPSRESYLAAASKEGVVAIWDIHTNTAKFVAKNHSKNITDIAVSAIEELLVTVGLDRKVYIYDLRSKEIVFNKMFSSELSAVACSLTGEEFAIGTTRGRIFFVDKRQPDYTKGSISAQKGPIKNVRFCDDLLNENNLKLKQAMSDEILVDNELSITQISNVESDYKTQASGDFTLPDDKSGISRMPGGMDDGLQDNNTEKWIEELQDSTGDKQQPLLQVIEESNVQSMMDEITKINDDIKHKFMEEINSQFLKIRMDVSREFCRIEQNNNKRWQEFNATLLKLAGCDESRKEPDNVLSETLTNESENSLASKPESLYSPAKTKVTNYTLQN